MLSNGQMSSTILDLYRQRWLNEQKGWGASTMSIAISLVGEDGIVLVTDGRITKSDISTTDAFQPASVRR